MESYLLMRGANVFKLKSLFYAVLFSVLFALPLPAQITTNTAFRIVFGASLPALCTANTGQVYFLTTTDLMYLCTATNTWTALAATGGAGSFTSVTDSGLTATRVVFSGTGGLLSDITGFTFAAGLLRVPTAIAVGATPATTGAIRLTTDTYINSTRADGTTQVQMIGVDSAGNTIRVGNTGATNLGFNTAGTFIFNAANGDTDFIIASDTDVASYYADGGAFGAVGAHGFGTAPPASTLYYLNVAPPAHTATSNVNYAHFAVSPAAAVTITTATTSPVVASAIFNEPNITATGTVTLASNVYIADAPTEGTANYALFVASGQTSMPTLALVGATSTLRSGTPVVTGNGTLVANSINTAGKVLSTVTAAATITVTFSSAWTRAPSCVSNNETTANLTRSSATPTVLTIAGVTVTGDSISYVCLGF